MIFLKREKMIKLVSACQSGLKTLHCVTLLTFRHLREIKSVQGKFDYQRKVKESNEGDLIIKGKKNRAMRET